MDNTTLGIGRDVEYLRKVSKASGVNIVAGAGFYVGASHPASMANRSIESLAEQIQAEIESGADGTDIKCGVIGEIGCSWPLQSKLILSTTLANVMDSSIELSPNVTEIHQIFIHLICNRH